MSAAVRGPALRAVLAAATAITGSCNADRKDARESSRSSALVTLPDGGAAPPTIVIASDTSVEATHLAGTVVHYNVQATGSVGDCAGSGAPSCPSWRGIGAGITCGTARGLVVDPANSDVLYASADDRGWKSLDRGQTWSIVSTSLNPFNIAIAPSGELYAAARFSDGIFKSLNGGQTWSRILSGQSEESKIITDPVAPGVLYVYGGAAGIRKSEDAGATWVAADLGLHAGIIVALAIDPATPTTLYAGHSDGSIFKTRDGGQTWQRLPTPAPPVAGTWFIAVSPADPNIVATSTLISRDGGLTWAAAGVGPALSMVFDPTDASIAYATTDTGVFKTVDGGLTWPRSDAGMINPAVRRVVLDRRDPTTLYVTAAPGFGNGAGVYLTRDGAASWSPSGFQAATCRGTALAVSPRDSRIAYAAFDDAGLFGTTDGGNTWHLVSRSFAQMVPPNRVASRIGWVTVVGETVWAAAGGGIFTSVDRGVTWNFLNPVFPSGVGQVIADEPATSPTLFAAAGTGILRSDDGGATWQLRNAGLPPSANVLALAIDPRPPFVVYALLRTTGVFRSFDHGQSWQADPGANWNQVEAGAIAIDSHTDPSTVVVLQRGFDAGVGGNRSRLFRRADHGQPFTEINYVASSFFPGDTLVADLTTPASRLYWPYAGGIQVSVDRGDTWTHLVGSTSLVHQPEKLVVAPSDGTIYALYRGSSNLTPAIAWRTTNATDAPPTASVVQGAIQPRCSPGPGTVFPMGDTPVTCTATDAFGQSTSLAFVIRVADTTPPVLSLPDTINATTEANGIVVLWEWGVEDNVSGIAGTPACNPPSGSFFLVGTTTTVTCTAQDQAGNVAQGSFLVRVERPGGPGGTPCATPAECLDGFCVDGVCCDSACGGGASGDCQACSIAAGAIADGTCGPAAVGTPCYTAAAFCEVDRVCSGTSLTCPSPTLPVDECAPTTDDPSACDGEPACAELLGGTDTVGGIELTFLEPYDGEIRVEASGQGCPPSTGFEVLSMGAAHGSGTYLDISAEPPTGNRRMKICIHYPQGDLSLAQEQGLRIAHGTTGGCSGPGDWTELIEAEPPDQPDTVNNIICAFTDSLSPFAIFVPLDADGPTFSNVPDTIVAYATSTAGATVSYTLPTALDAVDGPRPVACAPASGTTFAPGKTPVTCSASDTTGNPSSVAFTVWVQYQAPVDGSFFLKPIRADGSSVFKIGRPVPVKFQLAGASKRITDLEARLIVTKISNQVHGTADDESDEDGEDADFLFKYRPGKKLYAYRWKTRGETQGTYRLRADLGDDVVHEVNVSLRRPR
jgi:photosystem II stability/assembly factor-like uncharacterized protein